MPIIGRQQEQTLIRHHYETARNGQAHVVLLSGESGIGKTRLLDEMAKWVSLNGATVLRGGSSQATGMPPYLPFLEALGRYIQDCPVEQLETQSAATSLALATLLPELAIRLEDLPTSHPSPPEQARFRLYEAIGTFLQSIGASHTLVLIFDDLHWADSASLDLLSHVMRRQLGAHLLVLGAYRDSEINQNSALGRSVTELSRQRILTTIPIGPLSDPEIEALAERALGFLSPDVGTLLHRYSEGNPFFAEELLQSWIERRKLIQKQGRWIAMTPLDQTLPPSIIGTLRQRFAQLSPDCIDHLRVAAIIGRNFDLSLLATVKEQEVERVEECLLDAVHGHLLVRVEQTGIFTFSHDCIRACLYAEVSTSRRQLLHAKIGSVLETRFGQGKPLSTHQLAQLAFHFVRSDDRVRGSTYSEQAGTQALLDAAAAEAIDHYRTALDLLDPNDPRRSPLLLKLSQTIHLTSQGEETETVTGQDPRLQLAQMLVEQAERDRDQGYTVDLLKQALTLFEALGMGASAQRVRGKLGGFAEQAEEVPKTVRLPSGLTQRQVMIMRLVAQGKSNRQIAQDLGITTKTVSNHLTHIFNRTSCENRAAMTAFVFRHGLA